MVQSLLGRPIRSRNVTNNSLSGRFSSGGTSSNNSSSVNPTSTVSGSEGHRSGLYEPVRSHRAPKNVSHDGDCWQESLAVCEAANNRLVIRSYFKNIRSGKKAWDEPPTGATQIQPASPEMRRQAEEQLLELQSALNTRLAVDVPPLASTNNNSSNNSAKKKKRGLLKIIKNKTSAINTTTNNNITANVNGNRPNRSANGSVNGSNTVGTNISRSKKSLLSSIRKNPKKEEEKNRLEQKRQREREQQEAIYLKRAIALSLEQGNGSAGVGGSALPARTGGGARDEVDDDIQLAMMLSLTESKQQHQKRPTQAPKHTQDQQQQQQHRNQYQRQPQQYPQRGEESKVMTSEEETEDDILQRVLEQSVVDEQAIGGASVAAASIPMPSSTMHTHSFESLSVSHNPYTIDNEYHHNRTALSNVQRSTSPIFEQPSSNPYALENDAAKIKNDLFGYRNDDDDVGDWECTEPAPTDADQFYATDYFYTDQKVPPTITYPQPGSIASSIPFDMQQQQQQQIPSRPVDGSNNVHNDTYTSHNDDALYAPPKYDVNDYLDSRQRLIGGGRPMASLAQSQADASTLPSLAHMPSKSIDMFDPYSMPLTGSITATSSKGGNNNRIPKTIFLNSNNSAGGIDSFDQQEEKEEKKGFKGRLASAYKKKSMREKAGVV